MPSTLGADTYTFKSIVRHAYVSDDDFRGTISYYIQDPAPNVEGNCPSGAQTYAGIETYRKVSASEMAISLDAGSFCGASDPIDGTTFAVDPGDVYDASTNTDGWANNWHHALFRFDPRATAATFMDGSYVYAWQAGKNDSNTRVFNGSVSTASGTTSGTAYFAFGPRVYTGTAANANRGKILGMICAWFQGSHTPSDFVQRQTMTKSSGVWSATAANSLIKYAPVDSCSYYDAGANAITYVSSTAGHTNNSSVVAATSAGDTLNLLAVASGDRDGDGYFKSFASFPAAPSF